MQFVRALKFREIPRSEKFRAARLLEISAIGARRWRLAAADCVC